MSKLVKYHHDINTIPLDKLTEKEINLFFSIIFQVKEQGTQKIEFDFLELRKLSNGDINTPRFIKTLDSMDKKLLHLNQSVEIEKGVFIRFNLFNDFTIDTNKKKLTISIHEHFVYMLNGLSKNFTKFELEQLVKLKSSYSKNAFRLLKQFESSKYYTVDYEEFKRILCIPKTYRQTDINKVVLKPIIEELSPLFPSLKIEKVKKGRSIDKLIFTWSRGITKGNVGKVVVSDGLERAIKRAKKNRFIQHLITVDNIEKLLNIFADLELTEGLNLASKKINVEIDSLTYIINCINEKLKKGTKKIVVKSKDLQGVEPNGEVKEELTEDIREPKNSAVESLIKETMVKGKKRLKGAEYYTFIGLLKSCNCLDEVNEIILKYELNRG